MEPTQNPTSERFTQRVLIAVTIAAMTVLLLLLFLWFGASVFLLVFASVLLAVFLSRLSILVTEYTPLSYGWSLALVVLVLSVVVGIGLWKTGASLGEQVDELTRRLPHALQRLQQHLERFEWAQNLLAEIPTTEQQISEKTDVVAKAPHILSRVLGTLGFCVIFLFIALYLAIEPDLYIRGLLRLIPLPYRTRVQDVLHEIRHMLGRWLVGRMLSMLIVGVLTTLGLWLLHVPLALALGMLAALGEFVPNIGPLLAFTPAMLLAFTDSPSRALGVLGLYLGVQGFESYVLTPLVEKRAVALPPALTLATQVLLGLLAGGLGLVLAAPLAAVSMVLVQRLYVEDVLGDSMQVRPSQSDHG